MTEDEARERAREQIESGGLVSAIAERIGESSGVRAVFGEPVERDGVIVIPVARACWGAGGGGGGEGEDEGYGAGGGTIAAPHGFIEVADGKARYRRLRSPLRTVLLLAVVALAGAGAVLLAQRWER